MRVALDTNRLTDLFRDDADLADFLSYCEEIWVPLFVLGEIRAGFRGGTQSQRNEAVLRTFLAKSTVELLLPTGKPRNTTPACSFSSNAREPRYRITTCGLRPLRYSTN